MARRRLPAQSLQVSNAFSQADYCQIVPQEFLMLNIAHQLSLAPPLAHMTKRICCLYALTNCFQGSSVFIVQQHEVAWFDVTVQDAV